MNRRRSTLRRGSFLTEIVLLLPLIAATLTVIFQVSARAVRLQGQTIRSLAADARRDDLVRRIREDVGTAQMAAFVQTADAEVLTLRAASPTSQPAEASAAAGPRVEYRATGSRVLRIEQPAEGPQIVYEWDLDTADVRFSLEAIGEKPRIVWVSFVPRQQSAGAQHGPLWALATAIALDRGGVR